MFATNVPLTEGDVIDFISNGGGGYGNALDREPEVVLEEVIDGFMTIEKAREAYGVVIEEVDPDVHDYRIDQEATARLRGELQDRQLPVGYGPGEVHPDGLKAGELLARLGR
jgi:N-methylhydantoinase B